ncbi:OmpA family protein [Neolewinella antarctica]|uniref:Outer membrane protein OmpA-like peptidoglycan-associated protein n=1 Tax=Neolewinella antarctica TaxID=442734 RepID=A0ABX0XDK3_9BACT|nr:OmpA family protein [Neolewinella antarctica]NJC27331.1 outer membrane protein OmpA-like peptidoglycan-associated protein [Neolewinella antarctica]
MRFCIYVASLILLFPTGCATAQNGGGKMGKKETKQLSMVNSAIEEHRYSAAALGLATLIENNPGGKELYFLRSTVFSRMSDFPAAARDIERGIALAKKPSARPFRELGEALSKAGDFAGAKAAYGRYLELVPPSTRTDRRATAQSLYRQAAVADSLASNPVPFAPIPVPGLINTKESYEYHPTVSIDGEKLIFTRRVNREQEDFYFSERSADGTWSAARPLPGINSPYDEGAQTITADGSYLVYTSCNTPGVNRGCDLYAAEWDGERWTPGKPLGSSINTEYYESQPTLSQDGRFLIFSSKRPGGRGGADLYIAARLVDGGWSAPGQLSAINTTGDEQYPYWAADGRTLYFTSNGLPGLGGDDLFVTRLQSDNTWSSPRNLGYPINTAENETNMFVPLDGKLAYYSKRYFDAGTDRTQIDLFQFTLPADIGPAPATYVRAKVMDAETGEALRAGVTLQALTAALPSVRTRTDKNGKYLTTLPVGEDYAFTVDEEGYLFQSRRFTLTGGTLAEPFLVDIELERIGSDAGVSTSEADGSTAFTNVLFTSGSAQLLPVSYTELGRLTDLLKQQPDQRVLITGHTDDVGNDSDNLDLSRRRAAAVKTYLSDQGIDATRIETEGYGEAKPLATNDTETGRATNRRTTFKLLRP